MQGIRKQNEIRLQQQINHTWNIFCFLSANFHDGLLQVEACDFHSETFIRVKTYIYITLSGQKKFLSLVYKFFWSFCKTVCMGYLIFPCTGFEENPLWDYYYTADMLTEAMRYNIILTHKKDSASQTQSKPIWIRINLMWSSPEILYFTVSPLSSSRNYTRHSFDNCISV